MNLLVIELARKRIARAPVRHRRSLRIEDNVGESIHLHYRNLRLEFSIRDFLSLADEMARAADLLRAELAVPARRRRLPWALFARS